MPSLVNLGTAANYAILAESGISTVPSSAITGSIGVSPAAASALTGFALTLASGGDYSTSGQVSGKVYAANYANPTPTNLTTAVGDMQAAYTNAGPTGLSSPNFSPTSGDLSGLTLPAGIYKYSGAVSMPASCTISGSATDTWVFQVGSTLTQAGSTSVFLSGGALASNVFWVVPGAVIIGGSATIHGIVLAATSVTLETGSTLYGRILSQTAVALQSATINS